MASSISGMQGASQSGLQQLRVQQAQRNATQAEQEARVLRAEADAAQREALRADERARMLDVDASQAQGRAGEARQGLAALRSLGEFGTRLINTYERVVEAQTETQANSAAVSDTVDQGSQPVPVVNAQGQVTGQVVNVAA